MPIFRVKSVKIYIGHKKFTLTPSVASVTIIRYVHTLLRGITKCPCTVGGPAAVAFGLPDSLTVRGQWEPLHSGQGSISLEYQTYTSAYPFDTL